ncbi:MAG: hypothetical protein V2A79_12275 [Planctomycetota bacterium]
MRKFSIISVCVFLAGGLGSAAPPGTLDGQNIPTDYSGSTELGVQTNRTGFGDQQLGTGDFTPGSELDGLFLAKDADFLYVALTGNLERNGHTYVIFIDINDPGYEGQQELRSEGVGGPPYTVQTASREIVINTNGPGPEDDTWSYGANGTFLPCEADLALAVDAYGGTMSVSEYNLFDPNVYPPVGQSDPTPSNPNDPLLDLYAVRVFVGQSPINDHNDVIENLQAPSYGPGGFDDTNTTGVTTNGASLAYATTSGLEIGIPLSMFQGVNELNIFVAMVDGAGATGLFTNQVLPPTSSNGICNPPGTFAMRADLSGDTTCRSVSVSALPTFTGVAEGIIHASEYGVPPPPPTELQTCPTPYGDQQWDPDAVTVQGGSELDVLYADNDEAYLYLGITGNLEPNGNTLLIFIDSDPDGAGGDTGVHVIPNAGNVWGLQLDELPNGALPSDELVKYNYFYRMNCGGGSNLWVDFYDLVNQVPDYRGVTPLVNRQTVTPYLTGGNNPNNMMVGLNDLNEEGVTGCDQSTACHDETAENVALEARSALLGFEVAIPLADVGLGSVALPHLVKVWAYVTSSDGWASDQGLPSLRNVSNGGNQVQNAGAGPNNYTDPLYTPVPPYRNFEARAAAYTLLGQGACCLPDPSCQDGLTPGECALVGTYMGDGTTCDTVLCPGCIPAGQDCWSTDCGSGTQSNFASNPIPSDFFGPGSDPFDGIIVLGGGTGGWIDTIMARLSQLCIPEPPPGTGDVPIELMQLSLVSCAPITVTYFGGGSLEQWDVSVGLSATVPPPGTLTATKTSGLGGTFSADFYVQPVYIFTRVLPPNDQRIFDTGAQGISPILMQTVGSADWAVNESYEVCTYDGFAGGVLDDGTGHPCCEETCHGVSGDPTPCDPTSSHCHCTRPPECPPCPPPGDGDFDKDGDVDLKDFAAFQVCFGSTGHLPTCSAGDFNGDGDVDLGDYHAFNLVITGP